MSIKFDSEVINAWQAVRNDKESANWILVGLSDSEKDTAILVGSGTGGLSEFMDSVVEDKVLFGVFRVTAVDQDSRRAKFIYVTYAGSGVGILKKARVSTQKPQFENFFKGVHVSVQANEKSDISQEDLIQKLNASTGAHKPEHYEF